LSLQPARRWDILRIKQYLEEQQMLKWRILPCLTALGTLTILPACSSMMGGSGSRTETSTYHRTAEAASPPVAPATVKQVQTRLQQDGYYKTGNVDGVWGPTTETAVQKFQQDHQLSASGKLDVPTLQALNVTGGSNQQIVGQNDNDSATQPMGNAPQANTNPASSGNATGNAGANPPSR